MEKFAHQRRADGLMRGVAEEENRLDIGGNHAIGGGDVGFVLEIERIAKSANNKIGADLVAKINGQTRIRANLNTRLTEEAVGNHRNTTVDIEETMLIHVLADGNDDLVVKVERLEHNILVSNGERVERSWEKGYFHEVIFSFS